MFGGGSSPAASRESKDSDSKSPSPPDTAAQPGKSNASDQPSSGDKRSGNGSPPGRQETGGSADKKRRASGVQSKASSLLASAKNTLSFSGSGRHGDNSQSPLQKLGKQDPALAVPQGQQNNSAGESLPTPRSTFRVGVWEDRNKKCRRTMEDTHAFLYNFLHTPAPALEPASAKSEAAGEDDDGNGKDPSTTSASTAEPEMVETDNGYFAIFDGHAGTFAADWCGKKLHIVLEDIIRRNPNMPIPELLDQTFTSVDAQLEKLPLKNSGCTAAVAVLRWEDRVPSDRSATGSQAIAPAAAAATRARASGEGEAASENAKQPDSAVSETAVGKLKGSAFRQRVLYTANVGDARIVLCRAGKALRLSYDHKGSDENEGKRITNAGGLILNNRVNGVLAVTRALGDTYMKDLVTGHPYTTETVIHPESDEFVIVACDGLWDVCSDQEAVDLVRDKEDTTEAAKLLVDHALNRFSTDNLSCMVVRFDKLALMESQKDKDNSLGVEDAARTSKGASEADKIVRETKALLEEGQVPTASGVSAAANTASSSESNESTPTDKSKQPSTLDGALEEDAQGGESTTDSPEVDLSSKTDQKDAVEDAVKGAA